MLIRTCDIRPGTKISPGEALSEKLARTDGVLCPPIVGPKMTEKPAEGGALRVIPAPGAPGSNPNVRPN